MACIVHNKIVVIYVWASLMAQMVKNLLAMQETLVRSLGWEDPLEKGMATHFSFLAWKIPGIEEPGGLQYMGSQRVGHNSTMNTLSLSYVRLYSVCVCSVSIWYTLLQPWKDMFKK